jgi:hypothetical protein
VGYVGANALSAEAKVARGGWAEDARRPARDRVFCLTMRRWRFSFQTAEDPGLDLLESDSQRQMNQERVGNVCNTSCREVEFCDSEPAEVCYGLPLLVYGCGHF